MPMHIPSNIDTDPSNFAALLAGSDTVVAAPTSPTTQRGVLGILQREQDQAMSLLSLSPLLSSLFISYANKAAAHDSACTAPTPESEEWKALQNSISALRWENEKLQSENREIVLKLEAAGASQEASRSQQDEIESLRKELVEVKGLYDRLAANSSTEKATHKIRISDLEVQKTELKQTVVEQQMKISKFERQMFEDSPPTVPTRQRPSSVRLRNSLTPSEATSIPWIRTPSPEKTETASNSSPPSIPTREEDALVPFPGHNERAKPQLPSRGPPIYAVPKPQPHPKKASQCSWLTALNDSF